MTSSSQTVPADTDIRRRNSAIGWRTASAVLLLGLVVGCGDTPPAQTKKLAAQGIYTGALSNSGRLAFSAAQHQQVVIWDPQTGATLQQLSKRNTGITSARFSDDEKLLLLGYVNRRVELWNVDQGRLIDSWDAKARNPWHTTGAAILAVGFRSNRQFYALAGDGRLVELIPG
jgi:WD40 repeat protein